MERNVDYRSVESNNKFNWISFKRNFFCLNHFPLKMGGGGKCPEISLILLERLRWQWNWAENIGDSQLCSALCNEEHVTQITCNCGKII